MQRISRQAEFGWLLVSLTGLLMLGSFTPRQLTIMSFSHPQRLNSRLRLAIVGCGAIAEHGHLPGASQVAAIEIAALVDKDIDRARKLARRFGIAEAAPNLEGIEKIADAAVLCLPHHLHCPVAVDLISRGLHVLVEKPMALDTAECDQMIAAANDSRVVLAVGMMRRYFRCALALKQILDSRILGAIHRFRIEDGGVYAWPSASPFILSKAHSGGGVLMGNGSHVMDSLVWWFGEPREIQCFTNSAGGMETDVTLEMEMSDGSHGTVELSRTRSLANCTKVWTERGVIRIPLYGDQVELELDGSEFTLAGQAKGVSLVGEQDLAMVLAEQLRDFARAIAGHPAPIVTGVESRRSIALIESCYRVAKPLPEPWDIPLNLL